MSHLSRDELQALIGGQRAERAELLLADQAKAQLVLAAHVAEHADTLHRTVGGRRRRLGDLSYRALRLWLDHRRVTWPHTSNPHLLVTSISANDHSTVSAPWLCNLFRDLPAAPNQLRQDRILEEARATGADPLHLAAMFDFAADTGLRYASAVTPEPAPRGL